MLQQAITSLCVSERAQPPYLFRVGPRAPGVVLVREGGHTLPKCLPRRLGYSIGDDWIEKNSWTELVTSCKYPGAVFFVEFRTKTNIQGCEGHLIIQRDILLVVNPFREIQPLTRIFLFLPIN